ncbi:MAG: phosphomannomutase [Nitrosopumilus sp.]|nr:phosphomannomutase [Nitrosopumilus sp.]
MRKTVSGIRGIAGTEIGPAEVMGFCGSFSRLAGGRCVLGRDTRPSGAALADAAAAALMAGGTDVLDMGVAPTPAVFRESRTHGAGVIVTSSHNPLEWNGLKFVIGGRGLGGEELREMLGVDGAGDGAGRLEKLKTRYAEEAAAAAGRARGRPSVAIDAGGGAAAGYAHDIMRGIGCAVRDVPSDRGPDPTASGLRELAGAGGDIGMAFDLDGDRLVLVIGGRRLSPDATLVLGVAAAVRSGCRDFVFSADTSQAAREYVEGAGGRAYMAGVGEANVAAEISRRGADAGGEGSSGGFILPSFNWCRDGMLAGAMIAAMHGTPEFDEAAGCAARYTQVRRSVRAPAAMHGRILEGMEAAFRKEYGEVGTEHGLRASDGDGWVLVRGSNTEDVIRVSAEARDAARCAKMAGGAEGMVRDISA